MSLGEAISEGSSVEKILLHLNGNSNDDSGNGYNGVDTNVVYSKNYGKFNEGARFAQSDSKITIADNASLRFTNNFTVSFWLFATNNTNSNCYISKSRVVAGSYTGFVINKYVNVIGFVIFRGGTALTDVYCSANYFLNKWSHICCVNDNNVLKIYINGKLDGSRTTAAMVASTDPLIIGNSSTIYGFADANIDEVRIRTRALSAQEIQKEYTNSLGRFASL